MKRRTQNNRKLKVLKLEVCGPIKNETIRKYQKQNSRLLCKILKTEIFQKIRRKKKGCYLERDYAVSFPKYGFIQIYVQQWDC